LSGGPTSNLAPHFEQIEAELSALSELRDKPSGNIRITATDHVANTILLPNLAKFLRAYPDIKVEVVVDYGLTDIVAERYDAGVRLQRWDAHPNRFCDVHSSAGGPTGVKPSTGF
jgi:DNA-binding transcriptional LysR family regulator